MAEKKSPQIHTCPDCSKEYKTERGLKQHREKQHPEEYVKELKSKLDPRQEMFCQLYASDREFFGNGTQSYIEAFDVVVVNKPKRDSNENQLTYQTVRQYAHLLLTNIDILKRIDEIYEGRGLNDQFVDKQLEFVITQHAELPSKIKAITEYNKLKQRTTNSTMTVEHTFAKYDQMTDEELDRELEKGEKFFKKK